MVWKKNNPGCACCGCDYFFDDFNRANDTDVGDDYTETAGDWSIVDFGGGQGSLLIQDSSAVLSIDVAHPSGLPDGVWGFVFYAFDEADQVRFLFDYSDSDNYKFVEVETNHTESEEVVFGAVRIYSRSAGVNTLLAENDSANIPSASFHVLWVYWGPSCRPAQKITITGSPSSGTFTISFDGETTSAIAYDATAAGIASALEALTNITDVSVTGGDGPDAPWYVELVDPDHNESPLMTADGSGLSGGTDPSVAISAVGSNAGVPYIATYMPIGSAGLDNQQEVFLCQLGNVSFSEDVKSLATGAITTAVYFDSLTGFIHLSETNASCPCFRCCTCYTKDVLLLVDTTGSMGSLINNLKTIFQALESEFDRDTCRWAVAEYKDFEDGTLHAGKDFGTGWHVLQTFTDDFDLIITAVQSLFAFGGGDVPEQNFAALELAADGWVSTLGGRTDPTIGRRIIWGGDAPAWNGVVPAPKGITYPTRAEVIDALTSQQIEVYALNVASSGFGIDGSAGVDNLSGQASAIADATGGLLVNNVRTYSNVRDAICLALE